MKTWNLGYKKAKLKAKKIYKGIGRIPSPALNDQLVAFTSRGFTHLMRKGRIPRTRNEQKRRFVLIPHIEKIVRNPSAVIIYRRKDVKHKVNRYGKKILITSRAHFWSFVEKINDCKVKVVVRQLNNGQKHFFSVMGDNIQIRVWKNKKPSR